MYEIFFTLPKIICVCLKCVSSVSSNMYLFYAKKCQIIYLFCFLSCPSAITCNKIFVFLNDFWEWFLLNDSYTLHVHCRLTMIWFLKCIFCFVFLYIWLNVIHSQPDNKYDYEFDWLISYLLPRSNVLFDFILEMVYLLKILNSL